MKKRFTTLLLGLSAFAFINAQISVCDFDTSDDLDSVSSSQHWNNTVAVALNPFKTVNTTDSCAAITFTTEDWPMTSLYFPPVANTADYNSIQLVLCGPKTGLALKEARVFLKDGSAVNALTNDADSIKVINTWDTVTFATSKLKEGDEIIGLSFKTNITDPNGEIMYIDEIKLIYVKPQEIVSLPPAKTITAMYTDISALDLEDGEALEDIFNDADWHKIDSCNNAGRVLVGDFSSPELTALWDETHLYLYWSVTDDDIVTYETTGWENWQGDGAQLYMDIKDRRVDGIKFGELSGVIVNPYRETADPTTTAYYTKDWSAIGADTADLKQGSTGTGTAYSMELAIPWHGLCAGSDMEESEYAAILAKIRNGFQIAFDIQLNDAHTDGVRENMVSWCSAPKEPYGNSGTWGAIKLAGGPVGIKTSTTSSASVYPNPTTGVVRFENIDATSVTVSNLAGQVVYQGGIINNQIDLSQLSNGVYFVKAGKFVTKLMLQK